MNVFQCNYEKIHDLQCFSICYFLHVVHFILFRSIIHIVWVIVVARFCPHCCSWVSNCGSWTYQACRSFEWLFISFPFSGVHDLPYLFEFRDIGGREGRISNLFSTTWMVFWCLQHMLVCLVIYCFSILNCTMCVELWVSNFVRLCIVFQISSFVMFVMFVHILHLSFVFNVFPKGSLQCPPPRTPPESNHGFL